MRDSQFLPRQRDSSRYSFRSYGRNLFHFVLFDNDYSESLRSNFRVVESRRHYCIKREEREEERKRDVQGRDDVTKNERKEQSTLISASLLVARN